VQYETALKAGKFVLIAHGSLEDTTHAREILNRTDPETLKHHQKASAADPALRECCVSSANIPKSLPPILP